MLVFIVGRRPHKLHPFSGPFTKKKGYATNSITIHLPEPGTRRRNSRVLFGYVGPDGDVCTGSWMKTRSFGKSGKLLLRDSIIGNKEESGSCWLCGRRHQELEMQAFINIHRSTSNSDSEWVILYSSNRNEDVSLKESRRPWRNVSRQEEWPLWITDITAATTYPAATCVAHKQK